MSKLEVAATKDHFIKDGRVWFYLADTLWTAFSNVTLEEWEEYLDFRKRQNFNTIQINILHQWDGGESDLGLYPFLRNGDGSFDIYRFNEEYFKRAQTMLSIAAQKGFTPALVVLWCDMVPDTWATRARPETAVPYEWIRPYVEYIVECFSKYDPIYIISGDTDFGSERTSRYYLAVLEAIKELDPGALTTLHLNPSSDLPEILAGSQYLDFYMYQSGHGFGDQCLSYKLAREFHAKPIKRPVINGEMCYEGGWFGGIYGRYNETDVRKAIWQSLLSGAKAGMAYGAHGLWGWYRGGKEFLNEGFGGKPLPWRKALGFEGAWEASFAKWVFESFGLYCLEPADCLLDAPDGIRMSVSRQKDKLAIYIPYNTEVKAGMDLRSYDLAMIELSGKHFSKPEISFRNGVSTISMHDFNSSDVLLLGFGR